ncbi:hypothetical protein GDI0357 [Gluconacetobacter diazotrophicus PA1 5]|uniref:Uncharacterized protein n=1 Tax=Gluconacetobacter diazotrophicus (strain ATCC 49037 / DSM 5601 / CCUG 37298 / CIP 103539 / LMG 7603 / PAl5) TaxID=272568 RepID=A9H587_GLUDA|nr:hypothetical protein GDI0357 [Gluconacetobacter diazotrophicus PA1 5]
MNYITPRGTSSGHGGSDAVDLPPKGTPIIEIKCRSLHLI